MRKALISASFLIAIVAVCMPAAFAQDMTDHHHIMTPADTLNDSITQDWAKQRLAKSPRHQEWVNVKNGNRNVSSFIV